MLVVEDESALRGFLVARFGSDECELENIVVNAECRRRGLGRQLLASLISAARDRHLRRILLEVRESNTTARAFYEKFSFVMSGMRKSYYTDPTEDAVLYVFAP